METMLKASASALIWPGADSDDHDGKRPTLPIHNRSITRRVQDNSEEWCTHFAFAMTGVVAGIVCIVGIIGNLFSQLILWRMNKVSTTFFLLRVLSLVNAAHLLAYLVSASFAQCLHYIHGEELRKVIPYLQFTLFPIAGMALTASAWIMTLLTRYRYKVISQNVLAGRLFGFNVVRCQVVALVIASIACDIPMYFENEIVCVSNNNCSILRLVRTNLWKNHMYQKMYKNYLMILIRSLLPIFITTVYTFRLVRLLRQKSKVRHESLVGQNVGGTINQSVVTKVLVLLATVFVICQVPLAIYPILRVVEGPTDTLYTHCSTPYTYFQKIADTLGVLNSALNFFVYYPSIPMFRSAIADIFMCMPPGKRKSSELSTNEMTRSTSYECQSRCSTVSSDFSMSELVASRSVSLGDDPGPKQQGNTIFPAKPASNKRRSRTFSEKLEELKRDKSKRRAHTDTPCTKLPSPPTECALSSAGLDVVVNNVGCQMEVGPLFERQRSVTFAEPGVIQHTGNTPL